MDTITKLYKEWLAVQPLKPEDQKRLDNKFKLEFNYNSNHIEGNTLTYGQTQLLLMFDETSGSASLRDYEEMKAHNVGLEMVKREATDRERPLTESFIRELNRIILLQNFWKDAKTPTGDSTRMEVQVGVYKTRPNSVITAAGETFDYASPQETPAFMTDIVAWYNEEEKKGMLSPIELATLFHYRYIRIHPFEDGNGRIARLLVNYILLRHNYPMIIVRSDDKENYLRILHQCDVTVGLTPSAGAHASIEQLQPFVEYLEKQMEHALTISIKAAKGESIEEIGDFDKKAALLKKELGKPANEMIQAKYSPETVKDVLENSIYPLLTTWEEKLQVLDPLFMDRNVSLKFIHKAPFQDTVISDNNWNNVFKYDNILLGYLKSLTANTVIKGLRKINSAISFIGGEFSVQFFSNAYEVLIPTSKIMINKLYHQDLSSEEIAIIVEALGNELLENIDKIRKGATNKT